MTRPKIPWEKPEVIPLPETEKQEPALIYEQLVIEGMEERLENE